MLPYTAASIEPKMETREGASCDRCQATTTGVLSDNSYVVRAFPLSPPGAGGRTRTGSDLSGPSPNEEVRRNETARKALRQVTRTRRQRPWVWVLAVFLVNLGVSASIAVMADLRLAEFEQRVDRKLQDEESWRAELVTAQGELGRDLEGELADLRSGLTELRRAVSADEGGLQSVLDSLDALGARVGRIESMVAVLWRAPSHGLQTSHRFSAGSSG